MMNLLKKSMTCFVMTILTTFSLISQNLDIQGSAKISEMAENNSADSVVVYLPDGTLGRRDVATLSEFQVLQISNDTLFLSNGGFVKLPTDQVDDADADPFNEIELPEGEAAHGQVLTTCYGKLIWTDDGACPPLVDGDGNVYASVIIGNQEWLTTDLRTTSCIDGNPIALLVDNALWTGLNTAAYCWYNNDSTAQLADGYGALYNWYAVNECNLCPTNYHVPTSEDWTQLTNFLGDSAGDKLKESGDAHWISPNAAATNESGFTGLPGGSRDDFTAAFSNLGIVGFWWTSSESILNTSNALIRILNPSSNVISIEEGKNNGYSVRCIRDN